MQAIHQILAYIAVLGVVIAVVWTAVLVVTRRIPGRAFVRFQTAMIGLIILAALGGAAVFASGARPTDGLHLLYGGVAILLVPFARSFLDGRIRRDAVVMLIAVVALGGVMYRLIATG